MKLIYMAGPYRSNEKTGTVPDNVLRARKWAITLVNRLGAYGVFPVCPHLNTAHFEVAQPLIGHQSNTDKYWLGGTMALLERCDAVFVFYDIETDGVVAEVDRATKLGIPVYRSIEEILTAIESNELEAKSNIRQEIKDWENFEKYVKHDAMEAGKVDERMKERLKKEPKYIQHFDPDC